MSQELYYHLLQGLRSKFTGYVCTLAAVGLLASVPTHKSEAGKTLAITGALALSLTASANFRSNTENESALNDFRINAGLQRQRNLFAPAAVKSTEVEEAQVDWFNFSDIGNDRDKFPNVIILGEPGCGKSSIAEYLGCVLKANKRYAIHPHAKPTDFAGFDRVFGSGRNFGSQDDEDVSWEAIVSGEKPQPTIAQVLRVLLKLMNDRYTAYATGASTFDAIDVYIDEVPAIAGALGSKFFTSIIRPLLFESRKVGIRFWLLTQGEQVKLLGLEGVSDVREGISFIRLGRFALKYARRLKDPQLINLLSKASRPCLVDDRPAKVPGWSELTGVIKAFVQSRHALTGQTQVQPNKPKPEATIAEVVTDVELESLRRQLDKMLPDELESELAELIQFDTPDKGLQWLSRATVERFADELIDAGDFTKLPKVASRSGYDERVLYWIGYRLITEHAKSISNVIEQGWGMKGSRYKEANALYYKLGLDKLPKQKR